jgi:signal transduction histidine kinase
LVWLHIISDSVIALAYYSIPIVLAVFVRRRSDVAFGWVFWAFAIFILACGTTHLFGIWTLFVPDYGIEGLVKGVTALASLITAIGLLPLLPKALAIPSPSQLRRANEALQAEVQSREATVAELQREKEERAKAEEKLRHSQRMEAIGQLTAGIAHDFNNLLTVIIGSLEKAKRKVEQNRELSRVVGRSLEAAERAALLTSRLLAFGRQQPLAAETVNPNLPLETAIDTLRGIIGAEVEIIANFDPSPGLVRADVQELQNAVFNLCINARDAMPDGGSIVICTRKHRGVDRVPVELAPASYLEISVSDTGFGMAPDVAARAFEPFFTTKPVGKGSGLGLSQVYGFARQSGGTAIIESDEGSGTSVRIFLPRADSGKLESAEVAPSKPGVLTQPI